MQDTQLYVEANRAERERALDISKQSVENLKATMPYTELMIYPTDWPELTWRRRQGLGQGTTESDVNRRVQQALNQVISKVEFDRNRLGNVIDFLRVTTNLNFFVNWPVLQQAGVDQDKPISLQLTNVPAEQALKLVLKQATSDNQNPVTYSIVDGIVTISTQADLTRTTETRVYDIRDLLVNVPNFTNAPEFDLSTALSSSGNVGQGGGGGNTATLFGSGGAGATGTSATGKSREDMVRDITNLIEDSVGNPQDWVDRGGTVSSLKELNGNLIVKTTAENHRALFQLLAQLREARAMQISVEGRFLLVDQHVLDEVGLDVDVSWTPSSAFSPISFNQDSIDIAQRQNTGIPGSLGSPSGSSQSIPFTGISGGASSASGSAGSASAGFMYALQVPQFSYIADDLQVNAMLHATKANSSAISLTAPRITFFNGQKAYVMVADQIAFVSDLTPISDAIGFQTTLSVAQSGVVLTVEGTISADRRYVTMTVEPSLARIAAIRQIPVNAFSNVNLNNNNFSIPISGTLEAPELELTQLKTTVSVPDRGTLLLGGQRLVGETEIEAGVPVLSEVPILNRFFTNRSTVKDERTLLILVKPTIIIQSEEEENLFPGLMSNPEKYNIGRTSSGSSGVSGTGTP